MNEITLEEVIGRIKNKISQETTNSMECTLSEAELRKSQEILDLSNALKILHQTLAIEVELSERINPG